MKTPITWTANMRPPKRYKPALACYRAVYLKTVSFEAEVYDFTVSIEAPLFCFVRGVENVATSPRTIGAAFMVSVVRTDKGRLWFRVMGDWRREFHHKEAINFILENVEEKYQEQAQVCLLTEYLKWGGRAEEQALGF